MQRGIALIAACYLLFGGMLSAQAPPTVQTELQRLRVDLNGDSRTDILWEYTNGNSTLWMMNGFSFVGRGLRCCAPEGSPWKIKHRADFNGDGKTDLLWQHTDGSTSIWLMNGNDIISERIILGPGTGWSVLLIGDFNGDGKSDLLWQHTDGSVAIWLMNGTSMVAAAGVLGPGTGWTVSHIGDFNNDGKADLVWKHTDGRSTIWLMNGLNPISGFGLIGPATGWSVSLTGDFNGDGKTDLLWQNTDGSSALWLMDGSNLLLAGGLLGPGSGWSAQFTADLNGDGKSDLIWKHSDGSTVAWLMNGLNPTNWALLQGPGSGWTVHLIGDFDGDGKDDIVWRHSDTSVSMWLMNGLSATQTGLLASAVSNSAPLNFSPIPVHDNDETTGPASITLRFDGSFRDRVGQSDLARNPDGRLDGTFTVTLNAGSGNRTVTQLQLANNAGAMWNTQSGDGFWTLGAANGWDAALVNGANDAVNFPVADGGEFKIFGADFQNRMFLTGTAFTLTVGFSDGSTATGSVTIAQTAQPVVTLTATTPVDGASSGVFTVTRTDSTTSALIVNYTVGGTAVAGTHYAALSGSAVIAAGSATGTIVVVPVENNIADGDKTVVVTLSAGAAYAVGSPSTATVTVHDNNFQSGPATISLRFDGYLRDRVGPNNLARNPDGKLDATFTVTLNAGSGNRAVTNLLLVNSTGGAWDTEGGDGFWTLGAASGWDAVLLNGTNDTVNFAVADGGEFKIFAGNSQNLLFEPGTVFTLFVGLSDGTTATGNFTLSALPALTVVATAANAFEGGAGGLFTITRSVNTSSPLTVNYTVGGTAVAGTHITALSGSAVIAAGKLSATIAVVPVENSLADGDKTVVLTVSPSFAYSVGSPTATITVHDNDGPSVPVLISSPGIVAPGATLTVSWNGIKSPTNRDWIGLFAAGADDESVLAWIYVSCTETEGNASASGSCPFVVPSSLVNGVYELRLFSNGGRLGLAISLPFAVTPLDTNILITTPERAVAAAPKVATRSIARQECNSVFSIPYIQTGNVLTFNAAARTVPNGGGVVFVLSDSLGGQFTQRSLSPPFSARYTGLAKGEYRLDAYIMDSSGNTVTGELNHDYSTSIGIGDIYVAIGDSITEGYDGTAFNTPPYTNWLQAPIASHDFRNYPQCGISSGFYQDHWQEVSHHISLNNELEAFERYPVFILNEGVAATPADGYLIRMNTGLWQDRIADLKPNKWLVHLQTNQGVGGSTVFQNDMQNVIDTLKGAYAANGKDIVLAVPQLGSNWQPYINNLISVNGLTAGPDFNTFYYYNSNLFPTGHPNAAGHEQYARLWTISIMSPRNVAVHQVANGRLSVSWDDLQPLEPSIAGYKVYYGTNPAFPTNVVDVGHVLTTSFDVPVLAGQTYYFAVQGYDNDVHGPNRTSLSSPVGIAVGN